MERKYIVLTDVANAQIKTDEFDLNMPLKDNEAIIENTMTFISAGTELSRVYAIKKGFKYPVYPGYTCVGKVLRKGNNLDFEVGDRVFYTGPHASVNKFDHTGKTQGHKIYKIDERLSDKEVCILHMGTIAMNAVTACNGKITDSVAIYGLGTIGIITALIFKHMGMKVYAFDPISYRCENARSMGIEAYDVDPSEQVSKIKELTNNVGCDINIDVSGISGAINNCVLGAAKHGQVILLGSPRASYECDITPIFNAIHMKMLEVKGAFNELNPFDTVEGSRRSQLKDIRTVERLILEKVIDADKLISHVISPEEINEAYHGLMYDRENYQCVVIDWK